MKDVFPRRQSVRRKLFLQSSNMENIYVCAQETNIIQSGIVSTKIQAFILMTMGIFSFFQKKPDNKNRFVSEQSFKGNLIKQTKMTPITMEQLRKYNVTADKELKLEFFFYTNTNDKAMAFSSELQKLHLK